MKPGQARLVRTSPAVSSCRQAPLLLQVGDLQYASPATVSRCGMVYVDPKNLKYQPYWKKWAQQIQNKVRPLPTELLWGLVGLAQPRRV